MTSGANHTHAASQITSGTLAVARGGTGGGTAAAARDALGVQDGPRLIPLFAYATADSAVAVVQSLAGFTPADYAITGRTTTLTLDAIGSVTGAGLTATIELLNAAGTVVAQGWHRGAGTPHAEVDALSKVSDAHGLTAVVTLEPCNHTGRTGPCSVALIEAGVAEGLPFEVGHEGGGQIGHRHGRSPG